MQDWTVIYQMLHSMNSTFVCDILLSIAKGTISWASNLFMSDGAQNITLIVSIEIFIV